jgi:hypothetical protein
MGRHVDGPTVDGPTVDGPTVDVIGNYTAFGELLRSKA